MIEVSGNMISDLIQQEEETDTIKSQIDGFFDLLEERVLDVNPYCRSRLFQVYLKLLRYDRDISVSLTTVSRRNSPKGGSGFVTYVSAA